LKYGKFPVGMSSKERISLKMKTNQYVLVLRVIFQRNFDGILLRCLDHSKAKQILQEFHEGVCGGHFAPVVTAHKSFRLVIIGQPCSKTYSMIRKCLSCQKFQEI
jgi:hypothetical protein